MKKIFFLFIFFTLFLSNIDFYSNANITYFAKIESENIYLFSSPSGESENQLFILPKTYFVELLDDENDDFFKAKFKDEIGYVKKSQVSVMSGIPSHPYPNQSFRVFSLDGLSIYSSPAITSSTKIATIPYLENDIIYYGEIIGEQAIPDKSRTWYYCSYQSDENYFGYVYSVFCDKLTQIGENNESFEIVENPTFAVQTPETDLEQTTMIFIIIAVSLPCLVVLYLLIKPSLMKSRIIDNRPQKKKRHGDYFEFDENDLS